MGIVELKKRFGEGHDQRQLLGMIQFTHSSIHWFMDEHESSKKQKLQCRLGKKVWPWSTC